MARQPKLTPGEKLVKLERLRECLENAGYIKRKESEQIPQPA